MCNGKLLMKDRQLAGIDEEEINRSITELSGKLWQDINA
jgi:hypothetical protein